MSPRTLTPHDRVRLAAEACVHPRTVERVYAGERSESTTHARVCRAAELLGYPRPPVGTRVWHDSE